VPARDLFHEAVRTALQEDGWQITADPLFISFGGVDLYVDLGAERLIAATKGQQKIAVEIKGFAGPSVISDFHQALGQFLNYRLAVEQREPDRALYLAVPEDTYLTFFSLPFTQLAVQRHRVSMIVYDPEQMEIVQWIE
jgi:hypothetical protein